VRKLLPVLVACLPLWAWGQLTPEAPVANFRLPMFGDDGYRTWELFGSQGKYLSADKIEVTDMRLKVYAGDAGGNMEHLLESPKATLLLNKNIAIGEGPIKISSSTYRVDGQRWYWDGRNHSIVVSQNAKVTFFQSL
jgi:hypothetical protein